MNIMYRGRAYTLEDGGDLFRLTSSEKKNGRTIILEFIKDEDKSSKAVEAFTQLLRKTIISNHFKGS